jgi:aminobenzoyl-glutamate utilization protein B
MDSLLFEFFGKTAHGASADKGRSALDAVMLMDSAVNYLREHVPDNVRIHMCVPDGGEFPNVVPEYANAWYYVRGINRAQVDEVAARVLKCAKGAALQTESKVKRTRLTGAYSRCENDVMADAVHANMKTFLNLKVTPADKKAVKNMGLKPEFNLELSIDEHPGRASSDEDNVSWLAPFGRFSTSCLTTTATAHHRTYACQMKLPFAHRGMINAGEIFAGTLIDLVTKPEILKKAKAEFRKRTKGFTYDPLITKSLKPSIFDRLFKY